MNLMDRLAHFADKMRVSDPPYDPPNPTEDDLAMMPGEIPPMSADQVGDDRLMENQSNVVLPPFYPPGSPEGGDMR